ncbi:hypothetical protein E6R60_05545 [Streptomyces sp. A0642]|uniref:hypothetical protein n=1 Tax=unclassified Streptomyces TaxID=2593676 RepID=UPI0010A2806D|nr:hypothetical protein [Streptomyces sp. A0642]THA78354.1 hypothetical protein E6R60_05545 [Streptomyces sp. A0642]
MRWWIGARRAGITVPLALAVFLLPLLAVQNTEVALPGIVGTPRVALTVFVPVPLVACLMHLLESRVPAPEDSGVRPVARYDALLVTAVAAAALCCALLVAAVSDTQQAAATGRNVLFLAGLLLLGRAVFGPSAVLVPVAWLVLVVGIGFRGNVPRAWTIVPEAARDVPAAIVSLLVFAAGLTVLIFAPRKAS